MRPRADKAIGTAVVAVENVTVLHFREGELREQSARNPIVAHLEICKRCPVGDRRRKGPVQSAVVRDEEGCYVCPRTDVVWEGARNV